MSSDDEECAKAKNNGAVLNIAKIIRNVMTSAAGAEIRALYISIKLAIPSRRLLEEMGHKQPAAPTQTDNITALGFVTKNLNQKAIKSEDMNYLLVREKQDQGQFRYYRGSGKHNDGDYQTKHHCAAHQQQVRPRYLTPRDVLDTFRREQGKPVHVF